MHHARTAGSVHVRRYKKMRRVDGRERPHLGENGACAVREKKGGKVPQRTKLACDPTMRRATACRSCPDVLFLAGKLVESWMSECTLDVLFFGGKLAAHH